MSAQPIRTDAEQARVQAKLISRAVSLTGVLAAVLKLLRHGEPVTDDELAKYEREVREWNADARAISSEEKP